MWPSLGLGSLGPAFRDPAVGSPELDSSRHPRSLGVGELGEEVADVAELREHLQWVDDSRRALGFGEKHPIDRRGLDGYASQKIGRNDPCPCGSNKKYKKCCGR